MKYFVIAMVIGFLAIITTSCVLLAISQQDNSNAITMMPLNPSLPKSFAIVKAGQLTIQADLATTQAQWIQGLSGRDGLAPNTGMLFVFDADNYWGIWMKDMNFPIDVLWIASDFKITDIVENMTPASYPTDYKSHVPVRYVLEIPAGTVKSGKIAVGQSVVIKN